MELTTKNAEGAKMQAERIVYKERSDRINGACFEVYRKKGNGFLGRVYRECLKLESGQQQIPFDGRPRLRLKYKGQPLKQEGDPGFLCFGEIILEIKAIKKLTDEHRAHVITCLKATGKQLGIVVNFGHYPKIQHERFVNQPFRAFRVFRSFNNLESNKLVSGHSCLEPPTMSSGVR